MTLEEFYRELENHKHEFRWYLERGAIRGDGPMGIKSACPITSLVYDDLLYWLPAILSLGMDEDLADSIMDAADDPDTNCPEIRKRLLEILGLEEVNE